MTLQVDQSKKAANQEGNAGEAIIGGMDLEKLKQSLEKRVDQAIENNKVITLQTHFLSDYGEMAMKVIASKVLDRYGRMDLMDIVYTTAKELVMNATKANLKRIIFSELNLDPDSPEDYKRGMKYFKENLTEDKIKIFRQKFIKNRMEVNATFYFSKDVLNIKVKNNFTLLNQEELRIREKFDKARSFANLLDFYMQYNDKTEGEGLGLTMVGILLHESGIDRHCFTVYSNEYDETAARIEFPLNDSYVPRRLRFENERKEAGMTAEEYRKIFREKYKKDKAMANV